MARLFTGKGVSMELLREMETSPVSPPTDWACGKALQPCTTDQRPILTVLAPSNQGHNKASDQQWSEAPQMRLTIDADAEIQVDVLGHEAVLKVLGEARIGRGVRAFRRSPAEQGLGVR